MTSCRLTLLTLLVIAGPALSQTASTGGTTGGTTGATGGGSTVSTSGGGGGAASRAGASTGGSSSGPFAGTVPSGFSGGSGTTSATNAATGVGASSTTVPTANNPWRTTYGNAYAIGQSLLGTTGTKTGAATKGFGQPLYTSSTTGINAAPTLNQNSSRSGSGFNNLNVSKTPRYTAVLSDDVPLAAHPPAKLQSDLQAVLNRSSALNGAPGIRAIVDSGVVVLIGRAENERQRRIAESLIRLTPGVVDVDNRLTVAEQP